MIWLSTVWDSHSTQLQGPTGRFDGQFIKSKLCFQLVCMSNLPKFAQIGTYIHEIGCKMNLLLSLEVLISVISQFDNIYTVSIQSKYF